MRIVVAGHMVRHPLAGNLFAFFHYVLGLARLGHEVVYLEESGWSNSCYDPETSSFGDDPAAGLRIVAALFATHDAAVKICYVNRESGETFGATRGDIEQLLEAADLLINIGGVCWLPEFSRCRRLALIDMDPMFTQVGRFGLGAVEKHHVHFSYGVNIGRPECIVPRTSVQWIATVPPVVAGIWRNSLASADAPFTTVANWTGYGAVEHEGEMYGQKDEEFLRLISLPAQTSQKLEIAASGIPAEMAASLRTAGWSVKSGGDVSDDHARYQSYLAQSRGELSAAKNAYVKSHSGWFSDRSVCYLAAGRPVVLQDTGFTDWLPTGRGILAFTTAVEAAQCLANVNGDYDEHRRWATRIAERVFGHEVVLPRLLDYAMAAATDPASAYSELQCRATTALD